LFLRDKDNKPLVIDLNSGKKVAFDKKGVKPDLNGSIRQAGITHTTVFHKMAETYMSPEHDAANVAEQCGVSEETIRRLAAELAHVAFEQEITLPIEWTDFVVKNIKK
jgi:response regulator of citrate/malate metabolism